MSGLLTLTAGAAAGFFLLGWTNPAYTQRKFPALQSNQERLELRPRAANVAQLQTHSSIDKPLDVLVVGGGSVGTGVALDATLRGLKVGLIEMQDYASGTSSRSTKLIHGGVRYLEKAVLQLSPAQLWLVAEALRERGIMIHQAPHLCQPLPTLIPCYNVYDLIKFYAGIKLYDWVAAVYKGTLDYSRFIMPYNALRIYPALRTTSPTNSALLGAVEYVDGQMNDARLCFSVAMTASALGAAVVNHTAVTAIDVVANSAGEKLVKTTVKDSTSGKGYDLYSHALINAGGPFARKIEELDEATRAGDVPPRTHMTPSMGTHIVVDRQYCPRPHKAMIAPSSDGRVVFTIPWLGGCLLGTTDRPCDVTTEPRPTADEVNFLLENAKTFVGTIPPEAVRSVWAGIRPLATPANATGMKDTQSIVREHLIQVEPSRRMVSISGGKWTTYRKIAEEAVDTTIASFFPSRRAQLKPCATEDVVLLGARALDKIPITQPEKTGIPEDVHQHWRGNYGDRYEDLVQLAKEHHNGARGKQKGIAEGSLPRVAGPVAEVEVVWASRNEHCEHVSDFLARRTRMAFVDSKMAREAIEKVASIMGAEKGWSSRRRQQEIQMALRSMEEFATVNS